MWQSWDDGCGGGIFWSINHSYNPEHPNQQYYKSTITNVQHMELGARLYALTKNPIYITNFDRVNNWMKGTLIFSPNFALADGIDNRACTLTDFVKDANGDPTTVPIFRSYHSGEAIAANARMYAATGIQKYIDDAHGHFSWLTTEFTRNNVLYDPSDNSQPTGYLFAVYKALADLWMATPDAGIKARIVEVLQASGTENFKHCDSSWNCMRKTDPAVIKHTLLDGTNVRDQFEIVGNLLALAVVNGASISAHVQEPPKVVELVAADSKISPAVLYGGIAGGVALLLLIGAVCVVIYKRKKNAAVVASALREEKRRFTEKEANGRRQGGTVRGRGQEGEYGFQQEYSPRQPREAPYEQYPQNNYQHTPRTPRNNNQGSYRH
ncbi:UNVERIFIED_CONTAM: hydrolase 76 protein [Siphonaria sp. JEL0065]|nr:hydrolase 76 protein [Siphonaria sp. JEL0065]